MTYYWYVTPYYQPDRRLDGPFESRSDCESRCLAICSEDAKQRIITALLEGRSISSVTIAYLPRPFDSSVVTAPLIVPKAPVLAASSGSDGADLLTKLRALPRSKLLKIATAIGFAPPASLVHNRIALATRIYRELTEAARANVSMS